MEDPDHDGFFARGSDRWLLAVCIFLVFLGLIVMIGLAMASDWLTVADEWAPYNLNDAQRQWFIQQHNDQGLICCSAADGHPVDDEIRKGDDGQSHYWAFWKEEWMLVPDDAVVKVPNKVGRAVLWIDPRFKETIRCFIPGPGA